MGMRRVREPNCAADRRYAYVHRGQLRKKLIDAGHAMQTRLENRAAGIYFPY
jgi:hypothetical protein